MQAPEDYLLQLGARFTDLQYVGFGYGDEQGQGGNTPYPQLFVEAEMEIREVQAGLDAYTVALLFLDKPDQQGTQDRTRAEKAILQKTKRMADAYIEQARMDSQYHNTLLSIRVRSMLSLVDFNGDSAYGWRVELAFEYPQYVDREDVRTRFAPLPETVPTPGEFYAGEFH